MRKLPGFVAVCAIVLTSCSSQARTSAPLIPSGSAPQLQNLSPQLEPWVAHVVPFFSFGGGKERGVGGGGGGINYASGNFYGGGGAGGDPTCDLVYSLGCGFIYELTRSGSGYVQRILHVFVGPDGTNPGAYPIQMNGSFYGTASYGGRGTACPVGCGTVYEITPTKGGYDFRVIHNFTNRNGDGAYPLFQLAADAQGNLFGTTSEGGGSFNVCPALREPGLPEGVAGCGTVFKLTPTASGYRESVLYRFHGTFDGGIPYDGVLIQNGALIGTTKYNRGFDNCLSNPCGTVFELVPAKDGSYRYVLIHRFASGPNDGSAANGVIAGPNGVLYGETRYGGPGNCTEAFSGSGPNQGCGVVYALVPTGSGTYTERIVHRFVKHVDGIFPGFRMVLYRGRLYGTTGGGGIINKDVPVCVILVGCGTLFSVEPSGTDFRVLYRFTGKTDGAWPLPPLLTVNGSIYGSTLAAGQYGYGNAFRYTP
jgi:uncharacterized repeat protein (TIGR03803 family)